MPTARELLQQAEALMRRDRMALLADDAARSLDDIAATGRGYPLPAAEPAIPVEAPPPEFEILSPATVLDDIPLLTDAVDDFDNPSLPTPMAEDDDPSVWNEAALNAEASMPSEIDTLDLPDAEPETDLPQAEREPDVDRQPDGTSAFGPARDAEIEAEAGIHRDLDAIAEASVDAPVGEVTSVAPLAFGTLSASLESMPAADIAAPAPALVAPVQSDETRWKSLAEEVRMQVLQRIDIFTDTGLKEQLNARLQPIVDRASADLVAAINQHVGQLLREYVAEAIEREIEKWRQEPR